MTRLIRSSFALALVAQTALSAGQSSAPVAAASQPDLSSEPVIIESVVSRTVVADDGTAVHELTMKMRAQNDAGVRAVGTVVVPYARDLSQIEIQYVRVRKPDGRVVETPVSTAIDVPTQQTQQAPTYTDRYERHVNVRGFAAGDVLEYAYREQRKGPFIGHFAAEIDRFSPVPILVRETRLTAPAKRTVHVKTRGEPPVVTAEGNRRTWVWRETNLPRATEEQVYTFVADRAKHGPAIQVSTFGTWEDVGRSMAELWRDRAVITPEIREQAIALTEGLATEREKVQAIFSFVSTKVRYVSVSLGVGRVQPHPAAEVLQNGFGDCKDKHVLLEAMLAAIGIRAEPVLVAPGLTLDPDLPSPEPFSHVVTAISLADGSTVWVDATIAHSAAGHLANETLNRQGLLMSASGPARLIATPAESLRPSGTAVAITGTIDGEGTLRARVTYTYSGGVEPALRMGFSSLQESERRAALENAWEDQLDTVEIGDVVFTTIDEPLRPFEVSYSLTAPDMVNWAAGVVEVIAPPPSIDPEPDDLPAAMPVTFLVPEESVVSARIELPAGMDAALAGGGTTNDTDTANDFGSYRSRVRIADGVLEVEGRLRVNAGEIPPSRRGEYRALYDAATAELPNVTLKERWPWNSVTAPHVEWPAGGSAEANALIEQAGAAAPPVAIGLLQKAVALDPAHPFAWVRLADLQRRTGNPNGAYQSLLRQIEAAPSPAAYKTLASHFLALLPKRFDEAARVYREGAARFPDDRDFPALLGEMLTESLQYAEAVTVLESEIAKRPRSSRLHAWLGRAAAGTSQPDKAAAAFTRAVALEAGPNIWGIAALGLADLNRDLDLALEYATKAVEQTLRENTRTALPDTVPHGERTALARLALYADALGWVYFRKGELDRARTYSLAAWQIAGRPDVADRLGQIEEARGDAASAAKFYTAAMFVPGWRPPARVERFNRLVPVDERERARTEFLNCGLCRPPVSLAVPGARPGNTPLVLLVGLDGVARDVRIMSDDLMLQAAVRAVIGQQVADAFPGGNADTTFARPGRLNCGEQTGQCAVHVYFADDAL